MRLKRTTALGAAALSAAAVGAAVLTVPAAAGASTPAAVPVITVHVSNARVSLSSGNTIHAGRVIYRVVTGKGDQQLQVLRLHKGYTMQQAGSDIGKALGAGDVQAIRRIDTRITWRGGTEVRPNHPGRFAITLRAGTYLFLNFTQNSQAFAQVTVVGTPPARKTVAHRSSITAYSYGWTTTSNTIPATGWTSVFNQSDQPHLLALQHVKASTTAAMVRKFIKGGEHGQPSWLLRAGTSSSTISPYRSEVFHYSLPAGKYLMICWWPDDETGTAHVDDGMWKLLWLK